jgi:hypothetical protein
MVSLFLEQEAQLPVSRQAQTKRWAALAAEK